MGNTTSLSKAAPKLDLNYRPNLAQITDPILPKPYQDPNQSLPS